MQRYARVQEEYKVTQEKNQWKTTQQKMQSDTN